MQNKTVFASTLSPRFQAAHDHFTAFGREALQVHETISVQDEPSRAAFSALSRLRAFSDQIELILTLMREDVQILEELTGDPNESFWNEQFGDSFNQWLRSSFRTTAKVN